MTDALSPPSRSSPLPQPRMSSWQQAALSLFWFATNAHWTAILITLLPLQAELIGGSAFKGRTLGSIMLVGAFVSMVVAPLFGAWSDRIRTRWGRRMPFLVVGTIGNVIGLLALAFIPSTPSALIPYVVAFMWIELFNNIATAPYSALIPDVVRKEQRGSASGWLGLMLGVGSFAGGITGLMLPQVGGVTGAYLILAAIMVLGMLGTVLTTKEPPPPETPPFVWREFLGGMVAPFRSRDFFWVFWTRFLIVLGTFTLQEFMQYYTKDVIAKGAEPFSYTFFGLHLADTAPAATSIIVVTMLVGSIASSLVAGILSDRYGRKVMVYISGSMQAMVVGVFVFSGSFGVAVLMGIVFGLGYGAYQAVDWALASDVLPSEDDYARDMGVWHIAFTLPQVLATPVAGVLLDSFQHVGQSSGRSNLGYMVIFGLSFVYFVLGTVLVRKIKSTN